MTNSGTSNFNPAQDAQREGLGADLAKLERLALGRRRLLSLGALGGLATLVGAHGALANTPDDGFPPDGPPPDGPPPGGPPPGAPPPGGPGGRPPGPPPQVDNGPVVKSTGADGQQCIAFTRETQGPFPADGSNTARGAFSNALTQADILRADLRSDIGGGQQARGTVLDLELALVDVNAACRPLAGHAVYLWHCDAGGKYSLYDLPERSWLRGLQVADADGIVRFRTIVPGCYGGRYPHLHFEVFSSRQVAQGGQFARLTSQLAIPVETCNAVYARPGYESSKATWARSRGIGEDMVFGDNGDERIAAMTLKVAGDVASVLTGRAVIGIAG